MDPFLRAGVWTSIFGKPRLTMDLATAARAAFERRKAWESGGEVCIMAANARQIAGV
jgi:hypothetical protein